ncbi:hypothetical protein AX15_001261 [Amanita polypyramis BW_CC]|nr:hypothetical protein AX15_001261 [Amanita polypyramis BW_CC]
MSFVSRNVFENDMVYLHHTQTRQFQGSCEDLQSPPHPWDYMQPWTDPNVFVGDPAVYNALMEYVANVHPLSAAEDSFMPEAFNTDQVSAVFPSPLESGPNNGFNSFGYCHPGPVSGHGAVTSETEWSLGVPAHVPSNMNGPPAILHQEADRSTPYAYARGENENVQSIYYTEPITPLIDVYPSPVSNITPPSYYSEPQSHKSSVTSSPSSMVIQIEPGPQDERTISSDPSKARCCWPDCDHMVFKDRRCISEHLRTVHMLDLRKNSPRIKCQWFACKNKPMNAENLARHISSTAGHLTEKDHRCSSCLRLYYRQDMLDRHRKSCPSNKDSLNRSRRVRKMKRWFRYFPTHS